MGFNNCKEVKKKTKKTHTQEVLDSASSVCVCVCCLESKLTVDVEACSAGYDASFVLG